MPTYLNVSQVTNAATPSAIEMSPMQSARRSLVAEIEELHGAIGALESRLGGVSLPQAPPQGNSAKEPVELSSELRQFLMTQRGGVSAARERISALIANLDL